MRDDIIIMAVQRPAVKRSACMQVDTLGCETKGGTSSNLKSQVMLMMMLMSVICDVIPSVGLRIGEVLFSRRSVRCPQSVQKRLFTSLHLQTPGRDEVDI